MRRIGRAKERYENAARALVDATMAAFPIGTRVTLTIGRAHVIGEVIGHGDWYSKPDELHVRNLATGRVRSFSVSYSKPQIQQSAAS